MLVHQRVEGFSSIAVHDGQVPAASARETQPEIFLGMAVDGYHGIDLGKLYGGLMGKP